MSASSGTRATMSAAARLSIVEDHIDRCMVGEGQERISERISRMGEDISGMRAMLGNIDARLGSMAESQQELREAVAYMRGESRARRESGPGDSTPPPARRRSHGNVVRISLLSAGGLAALATALQRLLS